MFLFALIQVSICLDADNSDTLSELEKEARY